MSHDIWKNPDVKAALKEGRFADDIWILECSKCNEWMYYNQGSHFYCRKCKRGYDVLSEDEEAPSHGWWIRASEAITLADTVTCQDEPCP